MIVANKSAALTDDCSELGLPDSVVLEGVPWQTYQTLRWKTPNDHLRMTYDHGRLEIMSPQKKHGRVIHYIGLMIYEWTQLKQIAIDSGGNMTCGREDIEKALEPDLCYWIAHSEMVRDKDEVDLNVDPPPDLALEVDVTRSSIPKLPIYEALKIPEVWRWRRSIEVLHLSDEGQYIPSAESIELPGFPIRIADQFIGLRNSLKQMELMAQFNAAIRSIQ